MRYLIFFYLFFLPVFLYSQNKYPLHFFRSPVSRDARISSNFGEIRPNHFHAGLDYKAKEGENIYAIADGYVSRVKVSPRGYGNGLYITHPNGTVSVYAHLSSFYKDISDYVFKEQHNRQQFEMDDYLYPGEFKVKKGQLIGKSGNTGRSFGAHLHFEIRDEISEEPINPLLFGYDFQDDEKPRFEGLYLYNFGKGFENHQYVSSQFFKPDEGQTINANGKVGFGVEIHDYMVSKKDRFGVHQVEVYVDDSLTFSYEMERFSFDDARYLNSFTDFEVYKEKNKKVTKCFVEPNNKAPIYKHGKKGLADFSDGKLHKVAIVASDFVGNTSVLTFSVQSDTTIKNESPFRSNTVVMDIDCKKASEYKTEKIKIQFPENAFYYDFYFKYSETKRSASNFSAYHHVHNPSVPIHNDISIAIKAENLPEHLKQKAIIMGIGRNQQRSIHIGVWNGDFIETGINSFGTYYISVDTINPVITPITFAKISKLKSNQIQFRIQDHLSGIQEFMGYIDNQWVLFEYDEKNHLITCNLKNEKIPFGEHLLILWVKDKIGNIATYETKFVY